MTVNQHLIFALIWIGTAGVLAVVAQNPTPPELQSLEAELFTDEAALFGDEVVDEGFADDPFGEGDFAGDDSGLAGTSNGLAGASNGLVTAQFSGQQAAQPQNPESAVIVAVLDDAVLIRQGEIYRFYCCVTNAKPDKGAARPDLIDLRRDERASRLARAYHQKLYINPFALAGKVKIEASRNQGRMQYTVYPGTDQQAFATFGLQPGDNVLGINGVSLQRGDAIPVIYQQLAAADYVTVTLERQGRPVVVLLALAAPA